jgi:hypothetical protein
MIIAMPRDTSQYPDRCYMAEISETLKRNRSTIVTWDNKGRLPEELAFKTDDNGWRYWTREQLEKARVWVDNPERLKTTPSRYAAQ